MTRATGVAGGWIKNVRRRRNLCVSRGHAAVRCARYSRPAAVIGVTTTRRNQTPL